MYTNNDYKKHLFVVDAWLDTEEKTKTFLSCVDRLRNFDIEILLCSHLPVDTEIQKKVDYFLYDHNNRILKYEDFEKYNVNSTRWSSFGEYKVINKNEFHHDYAIWESMRNVFNFAKLISKEIIHFLEYDCLIDEFQFKQSFIDEIHKFDAMIYEYEKGSTKYNVPFCATYLFSIKTEIGCKLINEFSSFEEYFSNHNGNWQLEKRFYSALTKVTNKIYISKYVDNKKELNTHAVWNRKQAIQSDLDIQLYLCTDSSKNLYVHYITGKSKFNQIANDLFLEVNYNGSVFFQKIPFDGFGIIELGEYNQGETIEIRNQGKTIFEYKLNKDYESFNEKNKLIKNPNNLQVNYHFVDGAFVELRGESSQIYDVKFFDKRNNELVYQTKLKTQSWAKSSKKYYIDWLIEIRDESGDLVFKKELDLSNQKVLISLESKSLGDTLAWVPICEQFRKKHNCELILSTFMNSFFDKSYPQINFAEPGKILNNILASYRLGLFFNNGNIDTDKHINDVRKEPLQKIASDILGLEFVEERPILNDSTEVSDLKNEDYVCIGPHATALAKYWNRENGWQEVIDYLNNRGIKVVYISSEDTNNDWHNSKLGGKLKNVISKDGNRPLSERIADLKGAKAFIGVSSGLSWLAWATGTPVVLISGFTDKHLEFQDCKRLINENVCHGCWHRHKFDPGDWWWCPEHKNTENHFICTKSITSEEVIKELNEVLWK